jgi:hypothetical protein
MVFGLKTLLQKKIALAKRKEYHGQERAHSTVRFALGVAL